MTIEILEVGPKYNITLKKSLRKALDIEPGRLLIAETRGDTLNLRALPKDPFERLNALLGSVNGRELSRAAEKHAVTEASKALGKKLIPHAGG
jgi:bifunctional DNA-binding transcriptional regulator/antitoxin component of YhaV-PrlF toxin-antitoxin module